jgi:diadenosine tetraphosphate (Ap4A) HIT family hydrolase
MTEFRLDARLDADSLFVAELSLSSLRLMNDRRYPWTILVPRRAGLVEWHDLSSADQRILTDEITIVSKALSSLAAAHKMNVAALGNIVRQLHVHVIARREGDEAWPQPIWGRGAMTPYEGEEGVLFARRLAEGVGR